LASAGAIVAFVLSRTHGGTGPPANLPRSAGEVSVALAQGAARQYNPFGTSPEDPSTAGQAIDGNAATFWQTSTYRDGTLGKSGVGFYVDAAPHVAANQAVVESQTPGFHVQVWGTDHVAPYTYSPLPRPGITPAQLGWTLLAGNTKVAATTKIALANVRQRRYYLLWITDLGPNPGGGSKYVQIAEFILSRARR
jgi:hypothetical protein